MINIFLLILINIALSFLLIKYRFIISKTFNLLDKPKKNKIHNETVPIIGGLLIMLGFISNLIFLEVINIEIPLSYEIEFPPEYVPQILFDNIEILITNNKIFGKDLPLKPLNIFNEFNKMRILNFQTYKYIFDSIRNAI